MRMNCLITTLAVLIISSAPTIAQEKTFSQRYATVNGQPVTRGHVELLAVEQGVKSPLSAAMKTRLIALMIDRRLITGFLDKRKVKVDRKAHRRKIELTRNRIQKIRAENPEDFIKRIVMNRRSFEKQLETLVRWNTWLEGAITDDAIVAEFKANKTKYDGTRIRASQIFIKADPGDKSAVAAAESELKKIRDRITSKAVSFEAAAKAHSQAPTRQQGGDIGWLTYVGKMPTVVSAAIFNLKTGELSPPIRSPFGVHLCVVTDRKEGDLSPEDARATILRKLAEAEWTRIVESEKTGAKISKP